jgi:molecular chaperone DnaK
MTPFMRQMLSDSSAGMGIPLEFSIDPLTVVARGAAVFAGSLKIDFSRPAEIQRGALQIQLEYEPMGTDTEPAIGGKLVTSGDRKLDGYTVEFVNREARPPWRSGKMKVNSNGAFMTQLFASASGRNTYQIEVCDAQGRPQECAPNELAYTLTTIVFQRPPLEHNIGVETVGNQISIFFKKGVTLPARKMRVHMTAEALKPGSNGCGIHIPVVQGPYAKADLNRAIGFLSIFDHQVRREVPPNSEVEITLEIDESRILKGEAYIPVIDQSFELPMIDMKKPTPESG